MWGLSSLEVGSDFLADSRVACDVHRIRGKHLGLRPAHGKLNIKDHCMKKLCVCALVAPLIWSIAD